MVKKLVSLNNIVFKYEGQSRNACLDDVSFDIHQGEWLAIVET